jgi:dTDP-glucose 4,6-dehydratase
VSKILVTGGAGFIGSNFVRLVLEQKRHEVVNVDALTYAGNLENLKDVETASGYAFVKADITKRAEMEAVFTRHRPDTVVHFAAESHVDRSVLDASAFVLTNMLGTQVLIDLARQQAVKRFVHVSTTRSTGRSGPTDTSRKRRRCSRTRRTRPARPGRTCSCARPATRIASPGSSRAARTTTARTSSPRS